MRGQTQLGDEGQSPAGGHRRLVRDVLLRDGSSLRLEATTPDDFEDLAAFYDGLSSESRYFRFHGYGRTDRAARAEADASGIDRLALIGRHEGRVVAVASYEGLREPQVAEVSFAVADEFQRRGIGTRMLEQLAAIASERLIRRFDAEVMEANRRMLGVFEHVGFAVRREGSGGEVTVSLDITPSDEATQRIDERDHFAAIASLRAILAPSSVAVIGAATTPGNVGHKVLANIVHGEFQGVVEAVNRDGGVVCSLQAARTIAELRLPPELVIIAAAGDELLEFAAEAAANGARALLVVPAGPEDDSAAFGAQEDRLMQIVRDAGARLVGPNSLGVLNTAPEISLNATFSAARVSAGALAICSQSAAPGIGLLGHAAARQLGIAAHVSVGNRADVSTNDLLEYWEDDARVAAVMLHVETFGNPQRFTRIAQRVSRKKPILALKARRRAEPVHGDACSHTAAAVRGEAIMDALLHQAGVLRFRTVEDLFDAAAFFEHQPLPSGRRVAIVGNSAGIVTLAVDVCATRGLEVARLEAGANPLVLGIGAGSEEYAAALTRRLDDPGVDAAMVFHVDVFDDPEKVLVAVSTVAAAHHKPVVASVVGSDGGLPARNDLVVPNFQFPESCAAVLARAAERREWLSRPLGEGPRYADLQPRAARGLVSSFLELEPAGGWLSLVQAQALLATHGIPIAASKRCDQLERAIAAAAEFDGPIVMRADCEPPVQAGDIGAELVGLEGESAVRAGWRELQQRLTAAGRRWSGVILQPRSPSGADVLVGAVVDPDLGHAFAVGPGGSHPGLGQTAGFALLPRTDAEADELIDASEAVVSELDGLHGGPLLDRKGLGELILRLALLLREVPELVEADLNPIRCTTSGCTVLDLQVRIAPRRPVERVKTW